MVLRLLGKAASIALWIEAWLLALIVMSILAPMVVGVRPYEVLSGSMGEAMPVGSMVWVDGRAGFEDVELEL
ncbi:S26 family signal peptidase [Xiamenia xianingshaonis]|uniref:Signal peptidase I n=1 Tax=Xiamenia xianingshaonis TaxID=2682776 RepID=A0ABX0IHK1_9ACTN|nr:S26 family signal peptidase [Xiamenia xianingshaonis]NHM13512.1 hypothetical protein [Xiamenia xianingshaonis]